MCSDSEKNMSAFADQNHAPNLTCVRLEYNAKAYHLYTYRLKIINILYKKMHNYQMMSDVYELEQRYMQKVVEKHQKSVYNIKSKLIH